MMRSLPPILLALVGVAGCAPAAPDAPTWTEDVQPIVRANCIRCHGEPRIQNAPSGFRLDRYEDTGAGDNVILGAASKASRMAVRTGAGTMPKTYELTDRQKTIIQRWADNGAPRGPIDGPDAAVAAPDAAPTASPDATPTAGPDATPAAPPGQAPSPR
jgi:hypothetical protein